MPATPPQTSPRSSGTSPRPHRFSARALAAALTLLALVASLLALTPATSATPAADATTTTAAASGASVPAAGTATVEAGSCDLVAQQRRHAKTEARTYAAQVKKLRAKLATSRGTKAAKVKVALRKAQRRTTRANTRVRTLAASQRACLNAVPTVTAPDEVIYEQLVVTAPGANVTVSPPPSAPEPQQAYTDLLHNGAALGVPYTVDISTTTAAAQSGTQVRAAAGGAADGRATTQRPTTVTLTRHFPNPVPAGMHATLLWYDTTMDAWRVLPGASLSRDRRTVSATITLPDTTAAQSSSRPTARTGTCNQYQCVVPATRAFSQGPVSIVGGVTVNWETGETQAIEQYNQLNATPVTESEPPGYDSVRRWVDELNYWAGSTIGIRAERPVCEGYAGAGMNPDTPGRWPTPPWVKSIYTHAQMWAQSVPALFCVGASGENLVIKATNNRGYMMRFTTGFAYNPRAPFASGASGKLDAYDDVLSALLSLAASPAGQTSTLGFFLADGLIVPPGATMEFTVDEDHAADLLYSNIYSPGPGLPAGPQVGQQPLVRMAQGSPGQIVLGAVIDAVETIAGEKYAPFAAVTVLATCARLGYNLTDPSMATVANLLGECVIEGRGELLETIPQMLEDLTKKVGEVDPDVAKGLTSNLGRISVAVDALWFAAPYFELKADQDVYSDPAFWFADVDTHRQYCVPRIDTVSSWGSGADPTDIRISGECLGTTPLDYDTTGTPAYYTPWPGHGVSSMIRLVVNDEQFHACHSEPQFGVSGYDRIGCNLTWSSTGDTITFHSFDSDYASVSAWTVENGDTITIDVWNSEDYGPNFDRPSATCVITVGAGFTVC